MDSSVQVQKINSLAKELMSHGIAKDSADAFNRAKLMIIGEEKVNVVTEDKFEQELRLQDSKIRMLAGELKGVKEELSAVKDEIKRLKSHGNPISNDNSAFREIRIKNPPREKGTDEERRYTDKDVSIEKFFYYGQK